MSWDHPRSRGEYPDGQYGRDVVGGSSPLSRGILGAQPQRAAVVGIIPALAGNTRWAAGRRRGCTDHPRSRGEYTRPRPVSIHGGGSSPLSRGIPSAADTTDPVSGIIPALAGNTPPDPHGPGNRGDHPRSRGEYSDTATPPGLTVGSSPLSRGILLTLLPWLGAGGIIPALAGNTHCCGYRCRNCPDHPRSRGEYPGHARICCCGRGSSPLSRGIPLRRHVHSGGQGIIPALAGNTGLARPLGRAGRDHPRSRGEYLCMILDAVCGAGSSPLSRGIQRPRRQHRRGSRIIPALAGNTGLARPLGRAGRDHPRSRGEYCIGVQRRPRANGSSPLSRGILHRGPAPTASKRIIPALAGNTRPRRQHRRGSLDHPRSRGEYSFSHQDAVHAAGSSPLSRGILWGFPGCGI